MSRSPDPLPAFPVVVKNAYFAALKAQFDAQNEMLAETRNLAVAQEAATDELRTLRTTLPDRKMLVSIFDPVVTSLDTLNQTVGRFDRDKVDYVTALYAAVIETTGVVVSNTLSGRWVINGLNAANKTADKRFSVADIATLANPEKGTAQGKFIKHLVANAADFGQLPQRMTDEDLLRFVRLAPGVRDAIQLTIDETSKAEKASGTPPETKV